MTVYGIVGDRGYGMSLFMTYVTKILYDKGYIIYDNQDLGFDK